MSSRNISPDQFGPLYHGTDTQGATELDQMRYNGGPRYTGMRNSYGYNYATTDFDTAKQYAQDASRGTGGAPSVYEVTPRRKSESWGPDPDSGPNGWHDGPANKRDALELASYGAEVSLRFRSPLKAKEIWSEDKAEDISDSVRGGRSSFT